MRIGYSAPTSAPLIAPDWHPRIPSQAKPVREPSVTSFDVDLSGQDAETAVGTLRRVQNTVIAKVR